MRVNQFWVMHKKQGNLIPLRPEQLQAFRKLPSVCIVELTPDELAYIWPQNPQFTSLCEVCENAADQNPLICVKNVIPGYPCNFDAVPEAELSQDFDDFIIDGDFLFECGYFYSFEDFKKMSGFTEYLFDFSFIGAFPSVRVAREALALL